MCAFGMKSKDEVNSGTISNVECKLQLTKSQQLGFHIAVVKSDGVSVKHDYWPGSWKVRQKPPGPPISSGAPRLLQPPRPPKPPGHGKIRLAALADLAANGGLCRPPPPQYPVFSERFVTIGSVPIECQTLSCSNL